MIEWQSITKCNNNNNNKCVVCNLAIGNSMIKVSFCVPGPCGLVVLNALKASRDMRWANPSGGLLPTPVHVLDHHSNGHMHSNGSSLMSSKPGKLADFLIT